MPNRCSFCRWASVDSFETEAGNNAEIPVTLHLCSAHWDEFEKDENTFMTIHAKRIEELAYDAAS